MRERRDLYNVERGGLTLIRTFHRTTLAIGIGLFIIGILSGLLFPTHMSAIAEPNVEKIRQLALSAHHSVIATIGVIFLNNIKAAILFMLISGILSFGLYPAWALWVNGMLIGYVVAVAESHLHVAGWRIFVFGLLPHGLFELPAIIWGGVLGMRLGYTVYTVISTAVMVGAGKLFGRPQWTRTSHQISFLFELQQSLRQSMWIVGLLVIAACIEGAVTPHLIHWGIQ
jgi:stage II sporulation protein M